MARTRTTKKLAQRIDLNYFKRPTGLKRAKFWLSVGLPTLALVWIAWHGFSRDSRVYSSGRMSEAHAVFEAQCATCHVQKAGGFSARASDDACLSCHDGPVHHATQVKTLGCATCHGEHQGRVSIVAASNESCATCHGVLKTSGGTAHFESGIHSLEDGHPQFAALRPNDGAPASDPGTIRVNHAIHMKPIRRGPIGPNVQLDCGNCHQPGATAGEWIYADSHYISASTSYSTQDEVLPLGKDTTRLPRPMTGRELMAPVRFATACAGCHSLAFDKRFSEGVPHDKPEVVEAFLMKNFREYIAANPGELRETREPERDLTGKPLQASVRVYTPKEWVAARMGDAEELLWRKTCKQCHALTMRTEKDRLPVVEPARTTVRWMPHAKFDHDAHRGFSCVSCHEKALTSTEATDVLLPGITICKTCHAPGAEHAESRCFECHTYHDWSRRREVKATFTLPALRAVGR